MSATFNNKNMINECSAEALDTEIGVEDDESPTKFIVNKKST